MLKNECIYGVLIACQSLIESWENKDLLRGLLEGCTLKIRFEQELVCLFFSMDTLLYLRRMYWKRSIISK